MLQPPAQTPEKNYKNLRVSANGYFQKQCFRSHFLDFLFVLVHLFLRFIWVAHVLSVLAQSRPVPSPISRQLPPLTFPSVGGSHPGLASREIQRLIPSSLLVHHLLWSTNPSNACHPFNLSKAFTASVISLWALDPAEISWPFIEEICYVKQPHKKQPK